MVQWWVLVHCGQAEHLFQECPTPWPLPYSINLISGGIVPIICKTRLKNPYLSFFIHFHTFFLICTRNLQISSQGSFEDGRLLSFLLYCPSPSHTHNLSVTRAFEFMRSSSLTIT